MFNFFKKNSRNSNPKKYPNLKIGLALGGGATRGLTHIGVLKAFEEQGLKFDFVAGTSVGSLMGAFYCAGKSVKEMIEIAKNIKEKDIKPSKLVFVPSKTTGIENIITENLGDINIEDLEIPFSPVVVDIKSTQEVALRKGNLAKAVAGSCAIPGVFVPVEFENYILADGGLQNAIPADVPKHFGCDYVIAVDVNHERTYGTDSTKLIDVLLASIRILMKSTPLKGYMYSDVILTPNTKKFKATKLDDIDEMIQEGYRVAKASMNEILEVFARKPIKKRKRLCKTPILNENKVIDSETTMIQVQKMSHENVEKTKKIEDKVE